MCGISGGIFRPDASEAPTFIERCVADHQCRGPDHRAVMTDRVGDWAVTFGHTRLAIIDLTAAGNQPMLRGDRLVLSYNGEIFNYLELRAELAKLGQVFGSQTDTEVILAAYEEWGEACFERLNGFFALSLLDRARRRLILARDRFGVKPLHYHLGHDRLLFSSTAGPIAAVVGRDPDLEYLARGIAAQCFEDGSEATQYLSVSAVLPGHRYAVSLDGPTISVEKTRYYDLAARVSAIRGGAGAEESAEELVEECRERLTAAVELRLRADVPIGVSLSGGVDSATIAALASRRHGAIVGFTYGHPDRPETEGPEVAALVKHLGIEPVYVWPSAREMADEFWTCLEGQDSPFTSGSVVAQHAVYRVARAHGIKVVLGGQGGDEIFLGYRKSFLWRLQEAWETGRAREIAASAGAVGRVVCAELPRLGSYQGAVSLRLGLRDRRAAFAGRVGSRGAAVHPATVVDRQIDDVLHGGLPTLLRYEDRNSMACSVESRLPFMDYRLLEWAVALPTRIKLADGYSKSILRRAAAEWIPSRIVWQRAKRGFDVGVREWMSAGLGAAIRAELGRGASLIRAATGWVVDPRRYTDAALADDRLRFVEATTALWLGRTLR